jgi:hypothetical protein
MFISVPSVMKIELFVLTREYANVTVQIAAKFLPVEEGLPGLALTPHIIVEVQVVPISMPRVDLYKNKLLLL